MRGRGSAFLRTAAALGVVGVLAGCGSTSGGPVAGPSLPSGSLTPSRSYVMVGGATFAPLTSVPATAPPRPANRRPLPVPASWNDFYHAAVSTPYHVENSFTGLHRAVRFGKNAIDLDAQVTSDGVVVNTHWNQPLLQDGFRDPLGRIPRTAKVSTMTWAQVSRLRAPGGYRIETMAAMITAATRLGLRVEFELKASPAFDTPRVLAPLRALIERIGADVDVKTISNLGDALPRLQSAHDLGFTTIVLPRGNREVPRSWWPWIDYVRGPVQWV